MDVPGLRKDLLGWYRRHARDLPWRRSRDPYAIWVSEAMLQQTRVDVALPYYEAWLKRFPTVQTLAAANVDDVLAAWSGLGYYNRARNLHTAAKEVATRYGGNLPQDPALLRGLAGFGPYMSAAVASIAYGTPAACVDGNVTRVVSRLAAFDGAATAPARRRTAELAQAWLAAKSAGDWNQAMMDLGATVCTPRNPRCGECPVARHCQAQAQGIQADLPAPKRAAAPRPEARHFALARSEGKVLLVKAPEGGLLGGMWRLPMAATRSALVQAVREETGATVRLQGRPGTARHQFSHRTWDMRVHAAQVDPAPTRLRSGARWVKVTALDEVALPAATRSALRAGGVRA